jgi:hypothetical protein
VRFSTENTQYFVLSSGEDKNRPFLLNYIPNVRRFKASEDQGFKEFKVRIYWADFALNRQSPTHHFQGYPEEDNNEQEHNPQCSQHTEAESTVQ